MSIFQAAILAVLEGLTEFLPVSSTGHMILASSLMHVPVEDPFVKTYVIAIQTGAIMAIVIQYLKRFLRGWTIYMKLAVAFLPTAVIGFLAYDFIKEKLLDNPVVVSVALIIGGLILIVIDEKVSRRESAVGSLEHIPYKNAAGIGLFQCVSMVPGVSRAAATIIGGVFNGLDRKKATEFSFLLAVPTMLAATGLDLMKTRIQFSSHEILQLGMGMIIAFASAWFAVRLFVKAVDKSGFKVFGGYRIFIGIVYLILMKWVLHS